MTSDVPLESAGADTVGFVLDSHTHLWCHRDEGYEWLRAPGWRKIDHDFTLGDLERELDAAGVSGALVVQGATNDSDTDRLLELANNAHRVHGVVGWASLHDPGCLARRLDQLARQGPLVGVRYLCGWQPEPALLGDEAMIAAARVLAQRSLVLEVQTTSHEELAEVAAVARRVPHVRIVLDHLGRPPYSAQGSAAQWRAGMRALAAHPNVFVKFSGWTTPRRAHLSVAEVSRYLALVHGWFGASRIIFGGNWPVTLVSMSYLRMVHESLRMLAAFDAPDQDRILSRNASAVYHLSIPAEP